MLTPDNIPFTDILNNLGYGALMLYLTFRIFKVLEMLVRLVKEIKIIVTIPARSGEPPDV